MNEPLERWNADAPEAFRAAKSGYAELGPDAAQLARMLERVEQAAALPAPVSRLGFGARAWHWLLPVLTVVGATLWMVLSSPDAAPIASVPAPIEHSVPAAAPAPAMTPATVPADPSSVPSAREQPPATRAAARAARATPPSNPLAELALLDRARRVLAKDPTRALALAEEHRREYTAGQFAEERELLAIEALMRLDRRDAAQRRARLFRRTHPNSVHAHRLGVILSAEAP